MKEIKTKYPFSQFTRVGMISECELEEHLVFAECRRIRAALAYWSKQSGLPWRFRITTQSAPVGKITIERIADKDNVKASKKLYEKDKTDVLGDTHRKYNFGNLQNVGDNFNIRTSNPRIDRPSAHVAGKAWAKRRDLDWAFKVTISPNRLYINIKRIK